MDINKRFGTRIRELRKNQGYKQDEFAEECQISRAYYGRIERGEHSVSLILCELIAKTLGISLSKLFEEI